MTTERTSLHSARGSPRRAAVVLSQTISPWAPSARKVSRCFFASAIESGRVTPTTPRPCACACASSPALSAAGSLKSRGLGSFSTAAGPPACRRESRGTTDAISRARTSSLSPRLRSTVLRPNNLQLKDVLPPPGQLGLTGRLLANRGCAQANRYRRDDSVYCDALRAAHQCPEDHRPVPASCGA